MGHREDRVRPVGVGRPLVAVRDAAERGHALAGLEDLVVRHLPDAHAVGGEAGPAVEEDRGHAPQAAALAQRLEALQHLRLADAEPLGGRRVRLGHDRHRALGGADRRDVLVGQLDRVELDRLDRLAGRRQRVGAGLHLEVHADLEQLQRRQLADRLGAGLGGEHVERA